MKDSITIANEALFPEIFKFLAEGHTITIPLKRFSMRPFLEDGRDKALLASPRQPKAGDPVLAEVSPGHYVLHRLVRIDGDRVTLLGDGNLSPEHCLLSDIRASVPGLYRKGRTTLDSVSGRKWKIYSWWWTRLRPVRRWLLAFYRRVWIPLFGTV